MSDFLDSLRDDHETPLSRLGSSKALFAVTGGDMNGDAVRSAAAAEAAAATDLFDSWVATESNDDAADLFSDLADTAREHAETVAADADTDADAPAIYAVLDEFETTDERLGGALARALVSLKAVEQMVGFFIGDADPKAANTFRTLKTDLQAQLDTLEDAVDELAGDEDAARDAADAVVEAAYDEYVETLEGMGIKPKNVC
ncbi:MULTISPECIES: transcription antitermination protein [Haloferax]|uniref:Transcription antitermination protein n=1 Tax=Haloferax marinum TaxID=2666143 RepID=A0A6A8G648_9EURY|nr:MULTISPECIES: transcription antitermination protein [Haloferax]KAB1197687.1 transcription antitermination protein [Haloferax sp. CBA1150]MRW96740.1 transcription antitermination protein [Haloferax marinum]